MTNVTPSMFVATVTSEIRAQSIQSGSQTVRQSHSVLFLYKDFLREIAKMTAAKEYFD